MLDDLLNAFDDLDPERLRSAVGTVWDDPETVDEIVSLVWDNRAAIATVIAFVQEHRDRIAEIITMIPDLLAATGPEGAAAPADDGELD